MGISHKCEQLASPINSSVLLHYRSLILFLLTAHDLPRIASGEAMKISGSSSNILRIATGKLDMVGRDMYKSTQCYYHDGLPFVEYFVAASIAFLCLSCFVHEPARLIERLFHFPARGERRIGTIRGCCRHAAKIRNWNSVTKNEERNIEPRNRVRDLAENSSNASSRPHLLPAHA